MIQLFHRPALFYPYIHIRNINWLKASLLCFPKIYRMHPRSFKPHDNELLKEFKENNDGNVLLDSEYFSYADGSSPAFFAQEMLVREIEANMDFARRKFSYENTIEEIENPSELYAIHLEKLEEGAFRFLLKNKLAWRIEKNSHNISYHFNNDYIPIDDTIYLHPELGDALLTVSAIGVARFNGYDIITNSTRYHLAISTQNEEDVINQLFRKPRRISQGNAAGEVEELAQLVIRTKFDIDKLSAASIRKLNASGALREFKSALQLILEDVPRIENQSKRQERYEELAIDVIEKWRGFSNIFREETGQAITSSAELEQPNLSDVVTNAGLLPMVVSVPWLSIAVLSLKGWDIFKKWKEKPTNPYRYLTEIEQEGALYAGGAINAFGGNPEYGPRINWNELTEKANLANTLEKHKP